tara:strand:- start:504 stop:1028 length:525 start_codon:yes stop_codon:yes gene_type:complete
MKAPVKQLSPPVPPLDTQSNRFWEEIRSRRVDVLTSLLGFLFTGLLIGIIVPVSINNSSLDRDDMFRCWDSSILIREAANALDVGYATLPASPTPRNADLRELEVRLENARFACRKQPEHRDYGGRIDVLLAQLDELIVKNEAGSFLTYSSFKDTSFSIDVDNFATSVLEDISG